MERWRVLCLENRTRREHAEKAHDGVWVVRYPRGVIIFAFKSIRPATKFKSSTFRAEFLASAEKMAPKMAADMLAPTKTWKEKDKPKFTTSVKIGNAAGGKLAKAVTGSASGVLIEVTTDSKIYKFLDEGTDVRFATMTENFQPKTKVKDLRAYRGRGGLAFINKRRPKPGIKARKFSETVRKKWTPEYRKEMEAAMARAAKASGHGTK